jgi:hypothetical protein
MIKQITILSLIIIVSTTLFANNEINSRTKQLLNTKANQSIDLNQSDPINLIIGQPKRAMGLRRVKNNLASIGIVKYRLDSTVAPGSYKELSERDAQGRETRYTLKLWSALLNSWAVSEDYVTGYDQNGYVNFSSVATLDKKTNVLNMSKAEAVINNSGNPISIKSYDFNNTTKEFEEVDKIEYTYTADDTKILTETNYSWNSTTKDWEFANKIEVVYDQNGNEIGGSVYLMDDFTKTLYLDKKVSFEYDQNNNEILSTVFSLSTITEKLEPESKTEYVVNENGAVLLETNYVKQYDSNTSTYSFVLSSHYIRTYHTDGRIKSLLVENWDGAHEWWVAEKKEVNTFNEYDQNTIFEQSKWDVTTQTWIPFYQNVFTYPSNLHFAIYNTFIMNLWDTTTNTWQKRRDAINNYDANGNWVKYMMMSWRSTTDANGKPDGVWDGYVNFEFTHDLNFTSNQLLTFMSSYNHPNMVLTLPSYKWVNNTWVKKDEAIYYYSQQELSGISKVSNDNYTVFPNPAKNFITVKTDENATNSMIELYNLQGSKVLSAAFSNDNTVNIAHLAKGAYIYKMNASNGCFTGKIVKE